VESETHLTRTRNEVIMSANRSAVVSQIGGRVRLAFTRRQAAVTEAAPATPPSVPEIELVAFAEDCILSGRLRLTAERLSDLLNENVEFELVDVQVDSLAGGDSLDVRDVVVRRDELLLVQAKEPRGNAGRRRRTRQHPIAVRIGPYDVRGYVHTLPGGDPMGSLLRGKPMVALTDAVIEFMVGTTSQQREVGVVLMNREQVEWFVDGQGDTVDALEIPPDTSGRLVKDFTIEVLG
jgi:hypothetical protein